MVKFEALGPYVVVSRHKQKTQSAGGIILPESKSLTPEKADVVAIGDKVESVKVGDSVFCPSYGGREISFEGEPFVIFTEEELLLKLL